MTEKTISRRQFLTFAGLSALGAASACGLKQPAQALPIQVSQPTKIADRKRVLRFAHLTDVHVQPEGIAPDGMKRAFRHAQAQADPPDFILNTGDSIMDSLNASKDSTEEQWEVFNN